MHNEITVVVDDKMVIIDGVVAEGIDMSSLPAGIHAIQWMGRKGHIEHKDPETVNEDITDPSMFSEVVKQWEEKSAEAKKMEEDPFYNMSLDEAKEFGKAVVDDQAFTDIVALNNAHKHLSQEGFNVAILKKIMGDDSVDPILTEMETLFKAGEKIQKSRADAHKAVDGMGTVDEIKTYSNLLK